eukprot:m.233836 g.233836  ORF g.233836 m.233836 type:complete len:366 (-) comp12577_c0_seq1:53-1150(-)
MRVLCLLALTAAAIAIGPPQPVPTIAIDLGLAPEDRWVAAGKALVDKYGWDYTFKPAIDYITTSVPPKILAIVNNVSLDLLNDMPAEMAAEMRGLAQAAAQWGHGQDLPLSLLVTINLLYELRTACTGIVAVDSQGCMWHGRNLDWGFSTYSIRNITVQVNFTKGGATVYQGVGWVGYVGLLTGLRPGAFSVSLNQRETPDFLVILQALERIRAGIAMPVGFFVRDTLARQTTYAGALTTFANTEVTSSVYFILGGAQAGQGAIITRDLKPVARDVLEIPHGPQPWYVIETNYDHDKQPPQHDDRRDLAIHAMNALGQAHLTWSTMFQVLQTPAANRSIGVLNNDTQYSAVMSATSGFFSSWTWR